MSRLFRHLAFLITSFCVIPSTLHAQVPSRSVTQGAHSFLIEPLPSWVKRREARIDTVAGAPDAPATVLLADTQLSVGPGQPSYHVHRVVHVAAANALTEVGQLQIHFSPAYQQLRIHAIAIHRDGRVINRLDPGSIKLIERETELEARVYTGTVTAVALIEDLRVGDWLEYEYTITGLNPVFGGRFVNVVGFADQYPIRERHVRLLAPDGRRIRHAAVGGQVESPLERRANGMLETAWAARDVPVPRFEDRMPLHHMAYPLIQFSEFEDWRSVARWAAELYGDMQGNAAALDAIIARLGAPGTPVERRIAAALDFVQNEIRYFAVALGESSHRPADAATVLSRRYGDCKDKTALLIALLRRMGLKADAALVSTQHGRGVLALLPSPYAFDHVIARLEHGGRIYWLDGTVSNQVGSLAARSQPVFLGRALTAQAASLGLEEMKLAPGVATGRMEVEEAYVLPDVDRPAELTIISVRSGRNAEVVRSFIAARGKEETRRILTDDLLRRYPKASASGEFEIQDILEENRIRILERYRLPEFAVKRGPAWAAEIYAAPLAAPLELPQTVKRFTPLAVARDTQYTYKYRIELPDWVSANLDPMGVRIENRAMRFEETGTFRGDVASGRIDLQLVADEVPPSESEAFVGDVRRMRQRLAQFVSFARPEAGAASAGDPSTRFRARIESLVAGIGKSVSAGTLDGRDLIQAYTERALALRELGRLEEAFEDVRKALAIDRRSAVAHYARGYLFLRERKFDRAVADFSQALSLGHESPREIYKSRGFAHFYAGRFVQASDDFGRAAEGAADAGEVVFALMWRAWSLQRAGQALPESMLREFTRMSEGPWPRPALGLFTGKSTPEDVIKAAVSRSADENALNLCEAYFYVAQHYHAKGDGTRAKEYFAKAKATGVLFYVEHEMSLLELAARDAG